MRACARGGESALPPVGVSGPGACPSLEGSLAKPRCVEALRDALDEYGPNLAAAIDRLQAADPDLPIALMTVDCSGLDAVPRTSAAVPKPPSYLCNAGGRAT